MRSFKNNENIHKKEVTKAELEELSLLFEDRSFVDYFNIFLCLPVFGQHVYYNFMDSEFDFEPPIKQRRDLYLDKREVLLWLCRERFSLFKKTPLSTEYNLCKKVRSSNIYIPGIQKREETDVLGDSTLIKNVMGTALGMLMFRESLRGTCGETVYRCWRDIEAWRHIEDCVRRMYWKNVIKNKYIRQDSNSTLRSRVKVLVFQGSLNFDLVPEDQVHEVVCQGLEADDSVSEVESDEALLRLQVVLLDAMKKYWVPRFILHFKQTASKETMEVLTRPAPGDQDCVSHERRLRCRFMFPNIFQETAFSSPTSVFVSQSAGEAPLTPESVKLSSSEEEQYSPFEDDVNPTALFNLWTGPAKDIAFEEKATSTFSDIPSSGTTSENISPDVYGSQRAQSRNLSSNKIPRSPVPITLLSYLGGKKRTILGKFPSIGNRVSWSLASDALAGSPFRTFLFERGHDLDLKYLSFWTDVRNYLDTDDSTVDGYGFPLKRLLAHQFMDTYLSQSGRGSDLFSESLKNSLFNALGNSNDVSLLCMAQDIVLENLWEPLKMYIQDERRRFLKQVRGYRYNLKQLKTRNHLQEFNAASAATPTTSTDIDPMFLFQCTTVRRESASDVSSPFFDPTLPQQSATDLRAMTSYHISITEEQMWKAMELTVLCSEYGVSMMVPQYPPKPEQLVDVLHGDYGSLYVTRVPAQRNGFLRNLIFPPKINIETVRVSRNVVIEKVDLSTLERKDKDGRVDRVNRLTVRRDGMALERPSKPKTFVEVLTTSAHYDFFKRFMMNHKATMPLLFWKAVEELKELSNIKARTIRVTQIMRKYFGRNGKYGAVLDCHDDIIRQIPNMEKVTPGILICAQAAVYRSMERNWYPLYLDTYPPESGSSPEPRITVIQPRTKTPEILDVVYRVKQPRKKRPPGVRKTIQLWRNLAKGLVEFWKAMTNPTETQLLEIFLKCEIEKEQQNTKPAETAIEKNIMLSTVAANAQQTRVVIRNRLIILNKLPADLRFWLEVQKFISLADGAHLGLDTEFLNDKARAIISCFLASDVPPRIQVNIPNDLAANIMSSLAQSGPQRGMFHDAIFLLFPALNHYWKRYTEEWITGDLPDSYLEHIEKQLLRQVSEEPHPMSESKDYTQLKDDDIKASYQMTFDDTMVKIHFSISDGVSIIYPSVKLQHKPSISPGKGRRMTKNAIHTTRSTASSSPQKGGNKQQLPSGDKKDTRLTAKQRSAKLKEEETKEKEKEKAAREKKKRIIVKDPNEPEAPRSSSHSPGKHSPDKHSPDRSSPALRLPRSTERAQRLSQLVEALNTEREVRIRYQNRRYSKLMKFDEVVSAAIQEISESGSILS